MISMWDNIPILSYCILGGKCRKCSLPISIQYPLVEAISGLLFFSTVWVVYDLPSQVLLGICMWILLMISIIDAKIQGIPDLLNIPLLFIAGMYAWHTGTFDWRSVAIGLGFLGTQWLISGGRWVGSGDLILIAGISLFVGVWPKMILCLLLSYIFGACIAVIVLIAGKKGRQDALAFAPFLALGAFVTVYFGQEILMTLF